MASQRVNRIYRYTSHESACFIIALCDWSEQVFYHATSWVMLEFYGFKWECVNPVRIDSEQLSGELGNAWPVWWSRQVAVDDRSPRTGHQMDQEHGDLESEWTFLIHLSFPGIKGWNCLLHNKSQLSQGREILRYYVKRSMPICLSTAHWKVRDSSKRFELMLFFSGGTWDCLLSLMDSLLVYVFQFTRLWWLLHLRERFWNILCWSMLLCFTCVQCVDLWKKGMKRNTVPSKWLFFLYMHILLKEKVLCILSPCTERAH